MSGVTLIIQRTQVMLEDIGAAYADPGYITNHLAIVNDDLEQELQGLDLNFDTQVVIIPNLPANTTDLISFQAEGQVLSGMILPKVVEYRLVGQTQEDWITIDPVDKVVDTDQGTGEAGATVNSDDDSIESWEYRNQHIYLSPCRQPTDVRVRFQGLPTLLNADSPNQPARGLVNILAYMVCEDIVTSREGESGLAPFFTKKKLRALGNFRATQVKGSHSKDTRLGGRRSQGCGGEMQFRSPIV